MPLSLRGRIPSNLVPGASYAVYASAGDGAGIAPGLAQDSWSGAVVGRAIGMKGYHYH